MKKPITRWTKLIQPQAPERNYRSLTDSITRASTIVFENVEEYRARDWRDTNRYSYGLQATPISRRLEKQIALIDEAKHALLYTSGLNAICMAMMALLKAGDHILIPHNSYTPTQEIARFLSQHAQISYAFYNPQNLSTLSFNENTRMVWVETPGSITMEVADLPAIAALAKQHQALVGVDATWSAGVAFSPLELGADFIIHALTKYQSGGSDVLMGAISTNDKSIYEKLFLTRTTFGIGISAEDCYLILRSLPHLRLRYLAQDQSAREIASWLKTHPMILTVLHPALEECQGHAIWQRDFNAAASLFSVVFKPEISQSTIDTMLNKLNLFKIGVSWGGMVSLVIPFSKTQLGKHYPYDGNLARFYIGMEDTSDLIADITQAFEA